MHKHHAVSTFYIPPAHLQAAASRGSMMAGEDVSADHGASHMGDKQYFPNTSVARARQSTPLLPDHVRFLPLSDTVIPFHGHKWRYSPNQPAYLSDKHSLTLQRRIGHCDMQDKAWVDEERVLSSHFHKVGHSGCG